MEKLNRAAWLRRDRKKRKVSWKTSAEVASGGGQRVGSPATPSNAPAPRDETPSGHLSLRVTQAASPYPAHSSADGTDAFTLGTGSRAAGPPAPARQSSPGGPASLRDGLGSVLLQGGDVPEPLLAQGGARRLRASSAIVTPGPLQTRMGDGGLP